MHILLYQHSEGRFLKEHPVRQGGAYMGKSIFLVLATQANDHQCTHCYNVEYNK